MDENVKIAIAMRTARAALGMNQGEFSDLLGVAKSTIARIETLELVAKADTYAKMLRALKDMGVEVDSIYSDDVTVRVTPKAQEAAHERMTGRRSKTVDVLKVLTETADAEEAKKRGKGTDKDDE